MVDTMAHSRNQGGPNDSMPGGCDAWEGVREASNRVPVESDETASLPSLALTNNPEEKSSKQERIPSGVVQPNINVMNIKPEEHEEESKKNNVATSNEGEEHSYKSDPEPQVSSIREACREMQHSLGDNESRTDNVSLPSLGTLSSMDSYESRGACGGEMAQPREMPTMSTIKDSDIEEEKPKSVQKVTPKNKRVIDMSQEMKSVMEMYLDPDERIINNWRHIASKHGVKNQRIEWMNSRCKSPTLEMLKLPEFYNYTVFDLIKDLQEIKRFDCLYDLQVYLPDNDPEQKPAVELSMRC